MKFLVLFLCAFLAMASPATAPPLPPALPTWSLGAFHRPPAPQPIIRPDASRTFFDPLLAHPVHWEALHTFNPAAIVRNGKVYVLYRAEDDSGSMAIGMHTSRLGLAESSDGIHFTQHAQPVFYPAVDAQQQREQPGGTEDPRIIEGPGGSYVLTYTQWNRETYSVGIATSHDLIHWTKHGPAFGDTGKYASLRYKSAGILTSLANGRLVAAKIASKYWMYWGEGKVSLASSTDLIHWTPVEATDGSPIVLLAPRPGLFDSGLPEVGPPPVVTRKGILLLYNGKNAVEGGATDLAAGAYSVGQALFASQDPSLLLDRTDTPFFRPAEPFEQSGQYAAGTTFAEGLVLFHGSWFLYYGCADSFVGVAIAAAVKPEG